MRRHRGHRRHRAGRPLQATVQATGRGYGGPCPPPGALHRYRFQVYALDATFDGLGEATTADGLRAAFAGHVLAEGGLTGTFQG